MSEIAEEQLQQAIELHRSGNVKAAAMMYEAMLQASPCHPVALQWLATARAQQGDYVAALDLYGCSLKADPHYAEAYRNRGNVLHRLGRFHEALECFDQALRLDLEQPEAHNNRGNTLRQLQRQEEALASYDRALALKPDYGNALKNRGIVLRSLKRSDEALASYEAAISLRSNDAEAWHLRGNVLRDLNRLEEAADSYDRALAIHPRFADAAYNRSIALRDLLCLDEAIASCDLAISLQPNHPDAHWNKAEMLILRGDYEAGWRLFEWRWKSPRYGRAFRELGKPLWLGEGEVRGKTVLVNIDGGFGDTLQFCRYLPLLVERGARVILETQPSLLPLLRESWVSDIEFTSSRDELPPFDLHCPVMSLPGAFARSVEQLPASLPYLSAPRAHVQKWQAKLGSATKPRIGLVWSGSTDHANDRQRSIPLDLLRPLVTVDAEFHCLQKEVRESDRQALNDMPIVSWEADLNDYADTAALVLQMDLIISVDTSVAHLAGALAKPTWVLLPFAPEMRWLLEREDCPWYPEVMKLFRQETRQHWPQTIKRVREALEGMVRGA